MEEGEVMATAKQRAWRAKFARMYGGGRKRRRSSPVRSAPKRRRRSYGMARRRYGRRRGGGGIMRLAKPLLIGAAAGMFLGNSITGDKGLNGAAAAGLMGGFSIPALALGWAGATILPGLIGGSGIGGGSAPMKVYG